LQKQPIPMSDDWNGHEAIEVNEAGSSAGISGNCIVQNNIIKAYCNAGSVINLTGLHSPRLINNYIDKQLFYTTQIAANRFNGFNASDCEGIIAECNYIATLGSTNGTNLGSDFKWSISNNSFLQCNESSTSPVGFNIQGQCMNSIFRSNVMNSHANTGLYIGTSGVLGPQPSLSNQLTEGNRWTGQYGSGFGARNLAINVFTVADHRFLTNP
jgi:hypothetical protein